MKHLLCTLFFLVSACAPLPPEVTSFSDHVDTLFAKYDAADRPGYAIGVIRNGELILAKGYGSADIENSAPITADTSFNLASLSKQFTGAAVALEIERGTVLLEAPFADYWPDLPDFMSNITIAHLVYMTSGLPEYYTLPSPVGGWASEDGFTVDDAVAAVFAAGALGYEPGTRWRYSNINYQLLALLAARLHGVSFAERMQRAIFEPLDMRDTWVDAPIDWTRPRRATSYLRSDDGEWREAPRLSPHYGGSGVFSSLNDLAKWDTALYADKAFGETFTELMLSTRKFQHDKTNDAFGLVHGMNRGIETIWYEGGDYGVSTFMLRMPTRNETVICLANFADAQCAAKARAVVDILLSY